MILAAGAVDTPKLLQLSGVGDPSLLARQRVPLVHALPAVGRNLQDHLCVSFYFKANRPTLNDEMGTLIGKMKIGLRYLLTKRGPLAMSVNQAGGFFRGTDDTPEPNLQLYFNPLSYRIPKSDRASIKPEPYSGFLIAFNPCRPTSRGTIEIASDRAEDAAKIHINALTTQKDLDEAVQGSKVIRALMRAGAEVDDRRGDLAGAAGGFRRSDAAVLPRAVSRSITCAARARWGRTRRRRWSMRRCACTGCRRCGSSMRRCFRTSRRATSTRRR